MFAPMKLGIWSIAVSLVSLSNIAAQSTAPAPPAARRQIQITSRVKTVLSPGFTVRPQRTRNLVEATRQVNGLQTAYVAITTEVRFDHPESVRRLLDIANEADGKLAFTEICGWPALERLYMKRLAQVMAGREQSREFGGEPAPLVQAATIAIAEADTVIRFEGNLSEGAGVEGLAEILAAARNSTCSANPHRDEPKRSIEMLRQQLLLKPQAAKPGTIAPAIPSHREVKSLQGRATPYFAQGPGFSELQITTSNSGQTVVISSNGGTSFSNDFGDSFSHSTVHAALNNGDPAVGTGASGNLYLAGLSILPSGCFATVAVDTTQTGKTFNFQGNAVSCPSSSNCLPDQPQMAVDRKNSTPGGDQLYIAFRNLSQPQCTTVHPSNETPTITCSVDSGKTWQNQTVAGSGDLPRIAVGPDGFVYVTTVDGSNLQINKFSSCANGLQAQPHFPLVISSSFSGVNCPMDGQSSGNRCNSSLEAGSQPAVSLEYPSDVFVAYALSTSDTNDNVFVQHSHDGGLTWSDRVQANTNVNARRFYPAICTSGGIVNVSWYDRRAATPSDDSLTNYFLSTLSFFTSPPSLLGEQNVSINADSQKSDNGNDPKFGDYNGNACFGDRVFLAWASATAPPGLATPSGIQVFAATLPPGPPAVASVSPGGGGCGASTDIVIKGSNFLDSSTVTAVPQNLVLPAIALSNVTIQSHQLIKATVPGTLPAGFYEIVVQTPSGGSTQPASSARTDLFGVGPTITNINPSSGPVPGGTQVTITGACFGGNPNNVHVAFGAGQASKDVNQCTGTQCVVFSPAATTAGVVDIVVNVDGVSSPTTSADQFTYDGPVVAQLQPNHGPKTGGTQVIINGAGFPPYTGNPNNLLVSFGSVQTGALCLGSTVYSTTSCSVVTPQAANSGSVDVVAKAFGVSSPISPADLFTYDEFPALIEFDPPAQTKIVLNGNAPPPGGASVNVISSNPNVVQPQSPVTISAGSTSALVPLTIFPTAQATPIDLTATYQGSQVKTSFVIGASPALAVTTPLFLDVNQSGTATITLNTPAPAVGATITLTSSDPSAIPMPPGNSVPIDPGQFSRSFAITNHYGGATKSVKISAAYNGATASDFVLVPATSTCVEEKCPRGTSWDAFQCRCVRGENQ
jgi:hypothetical protein